MYPYSDDMEFSAATCRLISAGSAGWTGTGRTGGSTGRSAAGFPSKDGHHPCRSFRLADWAGNLPLFLQGEKQGLKNIPAFFALEFINGHGGLPLLWRFDLSAILNYEGGIVKNEIYMLSRLASFLIGLWFRLSRKSHRRNLTVQFPKQGFITFFTLLLLAGSFVEALYAAEKTVQLNIPGCASWGLTKRIGSILMATDGVIKHEMPKENMVNITFNDRKTSVKKIVDGLKKSGLTVNGKPLLVK